MCAFGMLEMAAQASVREESMSQSQAAPVAPGEQIVTLDVLRAFALLGILVMNMPFSLLVVELDDHAGAALARRARPRGVVVHGHVLLRQVQLSVAIRLCLKQGCENHCAHPRGRRRLCLANSHSERACSG